MKLSALIAANAAGPQDVVSGVLARFGFGRATNVTSRGDALARMREEHFDLVILPLQEIQPVELLSLEREIRKSGRSAVIGTAPSADSDLIVRAMRAGVHEFLVYPPSADDLAGAVERLMRRTRAESSEGELIAVYTAKGGLGCTTVAVNLAHAFTATRAESRVALADLVVTGGDVRVFLNLRSSYDLGHLVDKGEKVDAELLTSLMSACHGIWVLPTGENPELRRWLGGVRYRPAMTLTLLLDGRPGVRYFGLSFPRGANRYVLAAAVQENKGVGVADTQRTSIVLFPTPETVSQLVDEEERTVLNRMLPEDKRRENLVAEMASYGCLTRMHVVRLLAPALDYEDHSKDIDFSAQGIRRRREAGYRDTLETLDKAPWRNPVDDIEGFILHEASGGRMIETAAAN